MVGLAVVAIKMLKVALVHGDELSARAVKLTVLLYRLSKLLGQQAQIINLACDMIERYGIRGATDKHLLIDVQPHPNDGVSNTLAIEGMLYEYTANLAVAIVNVVRPLDFESSGIFLERVNNGQRRCLTNVELLFDVYLRFLD